MSISEVIQAILVSSVIAAIVSNVLSHGTKISEFRQVWINDLRSDIADYLTSAHQWVRKWDELNSLNGPDSCSERGLREPKEALPIANETRTILWRIKLRINPRENRYKEKDDKFLASLEDVFNPAKLDPNNIEASWFKLAAQSVELGRELLKREWEVTKGFWWKIFPSLRARWSEARARSPR